MNTLPFDKPGRFYRGNLHSHSNRSDGTLPPEAVVAAYRDQGYDFLALTDHFLAAYGFPITDTRPWRGDGFTTLLGAELHGPALANGQPWHIVAVGLPLDFAPAGVGETGPAIAARAAAAGAFVGLAHPAWYGLTPDDARTLGAATAIEIYNETCARDNDRGDGWYLADLLLAQGRRLLTYAADDAHFGPRADRFGAWVQVRAAALDPEAILAALKAGHFYASQGPELHDITLAGDRLRIACTPAAGILVSGPGPRAEARWGLGLVEADFPAERFRGGYCRVTVVDAAGKRAWSNPIWLD